MRQIEFVCVICGGSGYVKNAARDGKKRRCPACSCNDTGDKIKLKLRQALRTLTEYFKNKGKV